MKHPKDLAPLSPALPAVDRSATPGNGAAGLPLISHPDPEVVARAQRRRFTADYKLRILGEVDRCTAAGGVGAAEWFLWHGNVVRALETVEDVEDLVAASEETEGSRKLEKAVDEFRKYLQNNAYLIPNFGERRRNGEKISTSTAESTVNQVISERMVKKQQMRWSRRGAHLLLQVRTRELNGELRSTFDRWYPGLNPEPGQCQNVA